MMTPARETRTGVAALDGPTWRYACAYLVKLSKGDSD